MNQELIAKYGNKVRVRVMGLLTEENRVLLVGHNEIIKGKIFYAPPGGEVQFKETLNDALIREFKEETGLDIVVNELIHINEFFTEELHAIELMYEVEKVGGELILGKDPELENQIIDNVSWVSLSDIEDNAEKEFHAYFYAESSRSEIAKSNVLQ